MEPHKKVLLRVFGAVAAIALLIPAVASERDYQLVWSDEFDGIAVGPSRWEFQIGDGCPNLCGWGNNELQYYRSENASVANGLLTITAKDESFMGYDYTSTRMRTKFVGDWTYGRIEMRGKMPIGQGLWPAFWMLPTDEFYGGWAASGEIDILEYLGQEPDEIFGTLHYGGPWPDNVYSSLGYTLPSGTFHDGFHDFAIEWEPNEMRWFVDGAPYACQSTWNSTSGPFPAPFDKDFHLLLNMAVGGNLPGPPDLTTQFPQELVVDYVRVYQRPEFPQCTSQFDGMDHANPFGNGWFIFQGIGGGGIDPNTSDLPSGEGCQASLQVGWGAGGVPGFYGGFGREFPLDLTDRTHFSFWINPEANQDYTIEVNLQDDDNGDNVIPGTPDGADDEFQFECLITPSGPCAISGGGWQRVSIPLADFYDDNSYHFGGNGILDPYPTVAGGNGQLVNVVFSLISTAGSDVTFRTDKWQFNRKQASVTGTIWDDLDGDGTLDAGEPGLDAITVDLLDADMVTIASTTTASDGSYGFSDLAWNEYSIVIDDTTLAGNLSPTSDPDGLDTPNRSTSLIDCAGTTGDQDFGYAASPTPAEPTMRVSKIESPTLQLDVTYQTSTCNSSDHVLLFGQPSDFSLATSAECSVGNSGSASVDAPSGNVWILLAGREGARYSSLGQTSTGDRSIAAVTTVCPQLASQDASTICP